MKKYSKNTLESNIDILRIVYEVGNGIMLKSQVTEFMLNIYGDKDYKTHNSLKELERYGLIDIKKYVRVQYVKLKKSAISYFRERHYSEIKSCTVSKKKLYRVTMIAELILSRQLDYTSVSDFIDDFKRNTTYLSKPNTAHFFLNDEQDKKKHDEYTRICDVMRRRETGKENPTDVIKHFTLEKFYYNNIIITHVRPNKVTAILLDVHDNFWKPNMRSRIAGKIINAYTYLDMVFDRDITIGVICQSDEKVNEVRRQSDYFEERFINNHILGSFKLLFKAHKCYEKYFEL